MALVLIAGCGPSGSSGPDGGSTRFDAEQAPPSADAPPTPGQDSDGDGVEDADDNCPNVSNAVQADGDGDSIGDLCDCDPADKNVAAYLVLDDDLTQDHGRFATPPGFASADWSYTAGGYRQTRLADDAEDATFLIAEDDLTNILVEATTASTAIMDYGADDLRQLFFIARANSAAGSFSAYACGIEVAEGLTPTQETSVIELSGSPDAVTTNAVDRTDRAAVQVDEELTMRMELQGQTMSCQATIKGVTTSASATNVPVKAGSFGLYTRETKALFKNLKVCRFP